MKKKEHTSLFSRFKLWFGIWLCFLCALLFPFSVFASNKGLVGYWPLSERSEAVGSELYDTGASTFESGTYGWQTWGGSTKANVGKALEITYVDTQLGGYNYLNDSNDLNTNLVIGKKYRLTFDAKSTGGTATAYGDIEVNPSPHVVTTTLTGTMQRYTLEFIANSTTGNYFSFRGLSAGNVITVDNVSLKEVVTADSTPYNNDGSILNGPIYTAGRYGKGLGEELVMNGGFDTDSGWTKGTGWSIGGGKVNSNGSQVSTSDLGQGALGWSNGDLVQITYTISNYSAGTVTPRVNAQNLTTRASNGTFTEYWTVVNLPGSNYVLLRADTDFVGSIDNVSVREFVSGQAMSFDGVDDYVNSGNIGLGTSVSDLSVAFWMKGTDGGPFSFGNVGGGGNYLLFWESGENLLNVEVRGTVGTDDMLTTFNPFDDSWHHIIFTKEGTVAKIYVDGIENNTATFDSTYNLSVDTLIGRYPSGEFFNGSLSDVRIYDRSLSATEVAQLYNGSESSASTGSLNKGLVGAWPLNTESKKSATVVADTTPYNNNGTLSGAEVRNQGYYFDGVDDFIDLNGLPALGMGDWTVSTWYNPTSTTKYTHLLTADNQGNFAFKLTIDASPRPYFHSSTTGSLITTDTIPIGQWSFLVAQRSGNNINVWINGVLKKTGDATGLNITATDFNIGKFAGEYSNGYQADTRLYDRALSATEITNLYNGADIPGAIGHWPLSSGAGDVSGNGHNGMVSGATLIGEAASFDGGVTSGDMINLENSLEIDLTSFTLGFWVKRDSLTTADATSTTQGLRILFGDNASYKFLEYRISGGKFQFHGKRDVNSQYWASLTTAVDADTDWHYVTITGDENVFDVYMDGVYQGTDDDSVAGYTSNTCTISSIGRGYGAAHGSYGSYFSGEIKDLKYFDRPLSASEIKSLYDQGHAKQKQATIGNLNKGLVGHWPLSRKYTKDETVGSEIMADTTPYGNDGQNYGATVGSGYTAFDGSDYISTQLHLLITEDFTFSAWVNKTNDISRNTIIGSWSPWIWHIRDQEVQFETYIGSSESHISASTAVPYNTWTYLAMEYIYANDAIRFYINGDFDNEVILSGKLDPSSKNIYLGGYPNWRFHGSLDNVRIYNRTLSDREVKMLYDKGR